MLFNLEDAKTIMEKIKFAEQGSIRDWGYEIVDYDKIRIDALDLYASNRKISFLVKCLEKVQIIDMKIGDYNSVTYTIKIGDRKMTYAEKMYHKINNHHGTVLNKEESTDVKKYFKLCNVLPMESDCWGIECLKNNIEYEEDPINNHYFIIYL